MAIILAIYTTNEEIKSSPQEFNCTVNWKLEKIAYENGVQVERVAKIQDIFVESQGFGSAGGQGSLILTTDSPEQLVKIAESKNSTVYKNGTPTIYYEYNRDDLGASWLKKKYVFPALEGAFEWEDSQNIIYPENTCLWCDYTTKSSAWTNVPGENILIMEKTCDHLYLASIVIIIAYAIMAFISYKIWQFIDDRTYLWWFRKKIRGYIEVKKQS